MIQCYATLIRSFVDLLQISRVIYFALRISRENPTDHFTFLNTSIYPEDGKVSLLFLRKNIWILSAYECKRLHAQISTCA